MPRRLEPVLIAVLLGVAGCRSVPVQQGAAAAPGDVVAQGDGFTITSAYFQARWMEACRQPTSAPASPSACLPENRSQVLDGVIRFELLVAEARRQHLDQDPEVAYALEKLMVQKLVTREIGDGRSIRTWEQHEQRVRALDDLVAGLRERSHVRVNGDVLAAVPLEPPPVNEPEGL